MEKAILVTTHLKKERDSWDIEESRKELAELVHSSGGEILADINAELNQIHPAYFVGRGKAEEIARLAELKGTEVVIFSDNLSSTQQRNLEEIIDVKTIDRTQLILDIFARHARSREGKFQVELAQLEYLLPRLAGKGIMLSRLGGGIGTRGPGEQKLEVDRRRIRKRLTKLREDLKKLSQRRYVLRRRRREKGIPTVAIIGYTNAGKTSLLNALTASGELVRDSLFSTLDSVARRYTLPNKQRILFFDTVGFLHKLPHNLIEAFKATLEEVVEADILLHVLDLSEPMAQMKKSAVYEVLDELNITPKPVITALNKIDRLDSADFIERQIPHFENAVAVSALNKLGLNDLVFKLMNILQGRLSLFEAFIGQEQFKLINLIYEEGEVLQKRYQDGGVYIQARLPLVVKERLFSELRK